MEQILCNYVSYRAQTTKELGHPCPPRKDNGYMHTSGQSRGRLVSGLSICSNGRSKSMKFYSPELAPLSEFWEDSSSGWRIWGCVLPQMWHFQCPWGRRLEAGNSPVWPVGFSASHTQEIWRQGKAPLQNSCHKTLTITPPPPTYTQFQRQGTETSREQGLVTNDPFEKKHGLQPTPSVCNVHILSAETERCCKPPKRFRKH